MSRLLDVYLKDVLVGKLCQDNTARLFFTYNVDYLKSDGLPISISMPLQEKPFEDNIVRPFFSGLLPDDIVRQRLARYLGLSEKNPFSLLEAIGGECAGALSLYSDGERAQVSEQEVEILDDQKLSEILNLLKSRPLLAGDDGLRLSLAGAQDKIAVGLKNDNICIMRGTTPTTHILKPSVSDIEDSVHNELFCMRLANMVGIETPNVDIKFVNGMPYFLVERYDRVKGPKGIIRLHQEDFCQSLSIMPEQKYEREGGPSIEECLELISENSLMSADDSIFFLERIIFNYIIGNADAHGKNYSFIYEDKGVRLAPAYDLLSTAIYPELSNKMAMKIGGKYKPMDVYVAHWYSLTKEAVSSQKDMNKRLKRLSMNCLAQADLLKKQLNDNGVVSPVFDKIIAVMQSRVRHIVSQMNA